MDSRHKQGSAVRWAVAAILNVGLLQSCNVPRAMAQQLAVEDEVVVELGDTIRIDMESTEEGPRHVITTRAVDDSSAAGYSILIDKCLHTLVLYRDGEVHRRFEEIGVSYEGDKRRSGDGRTPEGVFFGRLYSTSQFGDGKAVLISYPDAGDAARGLEQGIISQDQHDSIVRAQERREMPPMWTDVGGSIAIHSDNDEGWYWTTGCPTLSTANINAIYDELYPVYGQSRNVTIGIIACDP
jgi:murein L,D-transpeptidase YafK